MASKKKHKEICPIFKIFPHLELIGSGSFGKVYKVSVQENGNPKDHALKVVQCNSSENTELALRESRALSHLTKHANVVKFKVAYLQIGDELDRIDHKKKTRGLLSLVEASIKGEVTRQMKTGKVQLWFQMEYCNQGDMNKYLLDREPNSKLNSSILIQLAKGISFLHENNITHRDLKPENILVHIQKEGAMPAFKIADFGLSKVCTVNGTENNSGFYQRVMSSACGSEFFMAPEVFDKNYTPKADVFSLGIIFWAVMDRITFIAAGTQKLLLGTYVRVQNKEVIPVGEALLDDPSMDVHKLLSATSKRRPYKSRRLYNPDQTCTLVLGNISKLRNLVGEMILKDAEVRPNSKILLKKLQDALYPTTRAISSARQLAAKISHLRITRSSAVKTKPISKVEKRFSPSKARKLPLTNAAHAPQRMLASPPSSPIRITRNKKLSTAGKHVTGVVHQIVGNHTSTKNETANERNCTGDASHMSIESTSKRIENVATKQKSNPNSRSKVSRKSGEQEEALDKNSTVKKRLVLPANKKRLLRSQVTNRQKSLRSFQSNKPAIMQKTKATSKKNRQRKNAKRPLKNENLPAIVFNCKEDLDKFFQGRVPYVPICKCGPTSHECDVHSTKSVHLPSQLHKRNEASSATNSHASQSTTVVTSRKVSSCVSALVPVSLSRSMEFSGYSSGKASCNGANGSESIESVVSAKADDSCISIFSDSSKLSLKSRDEEFVSKRCSSPMNVERLGSDISSKSRHGSFCSQLLHGTSGAKSHGSSLSANRFGNAFNSDSIIVDAKSTRSQTPARPSLYSDASSSDCGEDNTNTRINAKSYAIPRPVRTEPESNVASSCNPVNHSSFTRPRISLMQQIIQVPKQKAPVSPPMTKLKKAALIDRRKKIAEALFVSPVSTSKKSNQSDMPGISLSSIAITASQNCTAVPVMAAMPVIAVAKVTYTASATKATAQASTSQFLNRRQPSLIQVLATSTRSLELPGNAPRVGKRKSVPAAGLEPPEKMRRVCLEKRPTGAPSPYMNSGPPASSGNLQDDIPVIDLTGSSHIFTNRLNLHNVVDLTNAQKNFKQCSSASISVVSNPKETSRTKLNTSHSSSAPIDLSTRAQKQPSHPGKQSFIRPIGLSGLPVFNAVSSYAPVPSNACLPRGLPVPMNMQPGHLPVVDARLNVSAVYKEANLSQNLSPMQGCPPWYHSSFNVKGRVMAPF